MLEIGGHVILDDRRAYAPGGEVATPAAPIAEISLGSPVADEGGAKALLISTMTLPFPQPIGRPRKRKSSDDAATSGVNATSHMPHVANIGGQNCNGHYGIIAPKGEAPSSALADTIIALRDKQRMRRFCIVSQSRCDRSCEAFIARYIGMPDDIGDDPKAIAKARKAMFAQAQTLRKSVERGDGKDLMAGDRHNTDALPVLTPVILANKAAREIWDSQRRIAESEMRKMARTLPSWTFIETVAGFSDLGLAAIIGETGNLSNYATKERVWKRLGLAVIDGERQGRRSDAEQAAAHGFNPKRRAEIWAFADSMFKHQWRGAKEDIPAYPIGPYGEVYARRKALTVTREGWTDAHRDNDARRVMTKAFVEDLWKAWNRT